MLVHESDWIESGTRGLHDWASAQCGLSGYYTTFRLKKLTKGKVYPTPPKKGRAYHADAGRGPRTCVPRRASQIKKNKKIVFRLIAALKSQVLSILKLRVYRISAPVP